MSMDGFLIPLRDAGNNAHRAHEAKWWPTFRDMRARWSWAGATTFRRASRPDSAACAG